jgi:hypothetical protein
MNYTTKQSTLRILFEEFWRLQLNLEPTLLLFKPIFYMFQFTMDFSALLNKRQEGCCCV